MYRYVGVHMCNTCAGAYEGQKRTSDPFKLKLQGILNHVVTGKETEIQYNISKCSSPLSHLPAPSFRDFKLLLVELYR